MTTGTYISIITLNVNRLAPTKRYRLTEGIQSQDPYICCPQETDFRPRDTYRLKVKGWRKIFRVKGNQKKAGMAILISDKIDCKIKNIIRDKEGHYIMIEVNPKRKHNNCKYLCTQPQYRRETLTVIRGEISSNTIIVGDPNTPLTPMDRSSKQRIRKHKLK